MKLNKEKEQCEVQNCSYHKLQRTVGRKRPEQETIEADGVLVGDIKCKNDKYFIWMWEPLIKWRTENQ